VESASNRKKLTIFFSDVVNFIETTDERESEELTNLLNRYLTEMSDIALQYGATIDKFIGDAIMLFFGDPETKGVKEDARACVRMAIAMLRRMRELRSEWQELSARSRSGYASASIPASLRWAISAAANAWTVRSSATP
jgi:adenylate cyclase